LTPFRRLKTDPSTRYGLAGGVRLVLVSAALGALPWAGWGRWGSLAGELADAVRGQLLRQAARVLVFVLDEHRELPVLTWTVTPDVLQAHADVSGRDRRIFTVWADALPASEGRDPAPVLDDAGVTRLRAVRRVHGVPVVLTAAVHPY
jgi:hypothetical protein